MAGPHDTRKLSEDEEFHSDILIYRSRIAACLKRDWGIEIEDMPAAWINQCIEDSYAERGSAMGVAYLTSQKHGRKEYTPLLKDDGMAGAFFS